MPTSEVQEGISSIQYKLTETQRRLLLSGLVLLMDLDQIPEGEEEEVRQLLGKLLGLELRPHLGTAEELGIPLGLPD